MVLRAQAGAAALSADSAKAGSVAQQLRLQPCKAEPLLPSMQAHSVPQTICPDAVDIKPAECCYTQPCSYASLHLWSSCNTRALYHNTAMEYWIVVCQILSASEEK